MTALLAGVLAGFATALILAVAEEYGRKMEVAFVLFVLALLGIAWILLYLP